MYKFFAVAGLMLAISGCASVTSGGAQGVTIVTEPGDASITVVQRDGTPVHTGTTPANLELERGNSYLNRKAYRVTIEKAGYQPKTFELTWSGGWNLGKLVLGPNFGMVLVDPKTGMMWKVDPASLETSLDAAEVASASGMQRLIIVTPDNAPLGVWKHAERIQ